MCICSRTTPCWFAIWFSYCWLFALLCRRATADLASAQTEESPGMLVLFRNAQGISRTELANVHIKTHTLPTQWKPSTHWTREAWGWVWTEASHAGGSWRKTSSYRASDPAWQSPSVSLKATEGGDGRRREGGGDHGASYCTHTQFFRFDVFCILIAFSVWFPFNKRIPQTLDNGSKKLSYGIFLWD